MRKQKKRILNQAIVAALSISMTAPSMVAMADSTNIDDTVVEQQSEENEGDKTKASDKLTDESSKENTEDTKQDEADTLRDENTDESKEEKEDTKEESKDEEEKEDLSEKEKENKTDTSDTTDTSKTVTKEETTETTSNDESLLTKLEKTVESIVETVTGKKTYEKFGSDDFILWWFDEATDEEKEEWYSSISKYEDTDDATASNAKYPAYSSDGFDDWFNDYALKDTVRSFDVNGESVDVPELNLSTLSDWIKYQSKEDAFSFVDEVLSNYYSALSSNSDAAISTASVIGNLWPDTWGSGANYSTDGSGVKADPYVLDSVADLRAFARDVANGMYSSGESYFLLKKGTYDLNGTWIPIGFCLNDGDSSYKPFSGHFAGENGVVIKNIGFSANTALGVSAELASKIRSQKYAGFFGVIENATINNIKLQTSGTMEVSAECAGVLAGYAVDSTIRNVEVNESKVAGTAYVGGLIGHTESSSAGATDRGTIIEDVTCNKVTVYTNNAVTSASDGVEGHGAVGGVVGLAENTSVIDTTVSTNTGSGNHIYGNNTFVGGIVGVSENSDILNSFLQNGEVGSNNAFAVGGIVGGYGGGAVKVARFSGTVTKPTTTNNYSACFIGYRVGNAGFYYGENGDVAYLFADTKAKADTGICGSRIEDDGLYDSDAWIGYWHSEDTYCTIVSGDNQEVPDERFYQILENGILNAKNGTKSANGYENTDTINHYTADKTGNPTRGYLLSIENPLVDGVQAAEITAYVNGSYKETVTADNLGSFAPGDQVYISFTDLKDNNGYYRLDDDADPSVWYSYYKSGNSFYTYDNYDESVTTPDIEGLTENGGWVLTMPDSDIVVSAQYEKVAESVTTTPQKVVFEVKQIRTGDRSNPETKWEVTATNDKGAVITDSKGTNWNAVDPTNGNLEKSDDIRFWIGSMVNGQDNEKFNLTWTTSNTDENDVISKATAGNASAMDKAAYVTLNLYDSAINKQIEELTKVQHENGDKDSISTVKPYYYHSIVKAVADAADVTDKNNPPKGYLDITVKLSIDDRTSTKIDGVALSQNEMSFNVIRYLEGSRANPTVRYTINGEDASSVSDIVKLTAAFNPDYFTSDSVHWYLSEKEDKTVGVESDFSVFDDGNLTVAVTGDGAKAYYNAVVKLKGMDNKNSSANSFILSVNEKEDKQYTSQMMKNPGETSTKEKYVKVTAKDAVNNSVTDTCHVTINYKTIDKTEIMPTSVTIDNKNNVNSYTIYYTYQNKTRASVTERVIKKTDVANTVLANGVGDKLTASLEPKYDNTKEEFTPFNNQITWELANADSNSNLNPYDVLSIDNSGQIIVRGYDGSTEGNGFSPWVKNNGDGATANIRVIARSVGDNSVLDYKDITVKLSLKYINNYYPSSSSGGSSGGSSSGGGGGGSSSTGVTPSGTTTATYNNLPSFVLTGGQWTKNTDKWFYTNGRTFTNEWAAISNPYADASKGQSPYDWYHFNADSTLSTGWFTDDGYTYYLHPYGDGTQGRMYTGWNWIDDNNDGIAECYYFETESGGHKGSLYKSANTPDGYSVNDKGQWVQNGQVITRDLTVINASSLPSYVKTSGTWSKNASGNWMYADGGRQLKNEWAAINNPYADSSKGQPAFSWFHFNADGSVTTGWYTDTAKGATYYLNPVSDNTLGSMYTGWNWIDDNNDGIYECYYFEAENENTLGQLKKNITIGNYKLNTSGQWVDASGKVQTRTKSGISTTPTTTTTTTTNTTTNSTAATSSSEKSTTELNGKTYVTANGNLR